MLDLSKPMYLDIPKNVAEIFTDDAGDFDVGKYVAWMMDTGNVPTDEPKEPLNT